MTAFWSRTSLRAAVSFAILAALAPPSGCGDAAPRGPELADRWSFRADADDMAPGDSEADAPPAHSISLHLENGSGSPIYVQVARSDCTGRPSWFRIVQAERRLKLWRRCGECVCHNVRNGACPTEPCPASCAVGQVRRIETGAAIDHRWNGRYWTSKSRNGVECLRETVPASGTGLDVEYCWGRDVVREYGEPVLKDETCRRVSFVYGEATDVTHRVD